MATELVGFDGRGRELPEAPAIEPWERVWTDPAPIPLTEPQYRAVHSDAPVVGFVGGYGSGKTVALACRAIRLLRRDKADILIGAPTFDLIDLVIMPELEKYLDLEGLRYKVNQSKHTVRVFGYGKIILRSLETPGRIIGFSVGHGLADEIDTLAHQDAMEAFRKILARCRLPLPNGVENTVALFTTPEGFKAAYEILVLKPAPGTELIPAATYTNPWLRKGYVEQLRASYPAQLIDAYIEGKFVNLISGNVYPAFDRTLNATHQGLEDGPVHVGMDFNVANMSAVIHQAARGAGFRVCAVAELVKVRDTPSMIRALRETLGDRPVTVYPDATGEKRTTTNAAITDLAQLRAAGFSIVADAINPRIRDRVNSFNAQLCNAEGIRHYAVNLTACPTLVRGLETQAWDDDGLPEKPGGFDDMSHVLDAAGYFVHKRWPAARPIHRGAAEGIKIRATG